MIHRLLYGILLIQGQLVGGYSVGGKHRLAANIQASLAALLQLRFLCRRVKCRAPL